MFLGHLLLLTSVVKMVDADGVPPKGYTALSGAVARIYQEGVPHTDRNGNRLMAFDAAKSFLPLILYDAQLPCNGARARLSPLALIISSYN
eukprot:COSAG03_NODE_1994_length_3250_cov_170.231990_2_plen_91_part_00